MTLRGAGSVTRALTRSLVVGLTLLWLLGVLGSGQLGRMFAIAARRMGYRVHTLSPDDDTPTGQVADVEINAAYDRMLKGDVQYRFVIDNATLAA